MLHDIGKEISPEYFSHNKLPYPDILKNYPQIWHAFIAPLIIKKEFNCTDTTILNAVKWHTTGKARMSALEKILFIADYIEPNRKLLDIEFIKKLAYSNLDYAILAIAKSTIINLLKRNLKIHYHLLNCQNYYTVKYKNNDIELINNEIFNQNSKN
jgi:predicted HD superfamily hydrolase involved in NAD metabolism